VKNVTLSERIFVYIDWTPFINTQQGLWQRTDAHKVSIFCPPPLKSVYFLSMTRAGPTAGSVRIVLLSL
jgi:hypothetical protein